MSQTKFQGALALAGVGAHFLTWMSERIAGVRDALRISVEDTLNEWPIMNALLLRFSYDSYRRTLFNDVLVSRQVTISNYYKTLVKS